MPPLSGLQECAKRVATVGKGNIVSVHAFVGQQVRHKQNVSSLRSTQKDMGAELGLECRAGPKKRVDGLDVAFICQASGLL